jgi:TusA-related sulfurtransferase
MLRACATVFALLVSTSSLLAAPRIRNCPSAVRGAVTTADDRPDGVLMRVTADDPVAQREIRKRARQQATVAQNVARDADELTYCPEMEPGTILGVEELPTGALMRLTARSPRELERIRQSTRDRLRAVRAGD